MPRASLRSSRSDSSRTTPTHIPIRQTQIRAIQAPLAAFKDRCELQVSPTDALTVLADL